MRRATPFAAIIGIFLVQALAGAGPVLVFPLYLAVVLVTALQINRAESIAVAALAAIATLIPPLVRGGSASDMSPAVLLAAVLVVVAVAVGEVHRQASDTASRAQREAARLVASEQRMRTMLEAATSGLALADLSGNWVLANDRVAEILGRNRDELMRSTLVEVIAGEGREAVAQALEMLRSGDVQHWEAEVWQLRGDADRVPVAISIAKLPAQPSGDETLLVQLTDISERKRLDRLRECLVAVRQVTAGSGSWESAMPVLLSALAVHLDCEVALQWGVDTELQSMRVRHSWSAEAAPVQEYVARSLGLSVGTGQGLVGRAWRSGVLAAEGDLDQAAEGERLLLARGSELKAVIAVPIVDAGVVVGVIELASLRPHPIRDDEVTMLAALGVEIGQFIRRSDVAQALRRSEADHRAIYERSAIGIARISAGGELLEANPALLAMLQHDFETMRESTWPDLLRAYDQAAARHKTAPLLAGITDGSTVQVRAATAAGNWLWLQLTTTSIPDSNGRPEHVLLMVEDVTEVRETSDKLAEALDAQRAANANLEKIDHTKTEFLSIVSHEFRTALTGIQGFSELIRDGGLEADEVRAYGGYIFNDADRVNRLIGDMLDLDRMESGRMTMRASNVDINEVLSEAIARAGGGTTSVEFKSDLDPRLPIVAGDRDRLIQVVSNLVNNAIKYSPDGGVVTLSSRAEGNFALISVMDTGLGIPPEEIGHVFERFRRVRSGAAQSIPGTGLGLTIVKQIVEMHGGKIWVESAVGLGSAFHFTVPLTAAGIEPLQLQRA